MGTYFFDTSALVKRYNQEPGTGQVDSLLDDESNDIVISSLAVIETVSAFRRKYNRDEITESEMDQSIGVFFRESLDDFVILPLAESLLTFSFHLILEDNLRTLDSLQLSTGLRIDNDLDSATFVTADERLADIGRGRGLDTIVPG